MKITDIMNITNKMNKTNIIKILVILSLSVVVVIFLIGLVGVIKKGRINLDDFRKSKRSKESFINFGEKEDTKMLGDPHLIAIHNAPQEKDSEYEFKKKTYDKLKKKMYVTPAFRPNDSGDPMLGVPIKSGESQTRNGKWESIYTSQEPVNYSNLRKRTTGLYTDIGLAQPGKEYEYGPLGYNNEDANTMNNLGNCNCLLDDKKYKKPKNQKNRPKLVEGYVNINGSVSPSEFINDTPIPNTDTILESLIPTEQEIQEAITHKLSKASEEALNQAVIDSEKMILAKAKAISTSIGESLDADGIESSECPTCPPGSNI